MESTGNAPSMQVSGSTWFKRAPEGLLQAMRGWVYWGFPSSATRHAAGRINRLSMGLLLTARTAVTLEACQSPGPSYLRLLTMRPMPDASAASSTYHIHYKGTCSAFAGQAHLQPAINEVRVSRSGARADGALRPPRLVQQHWLGGSRTDTTTAITSSETAMAGDIAGHRCNCSRPLEEPLSYKHSCCFRYPQCLQKRH